MITKTASTLVASVITKTASTRAFVPVTTEAARALAASVVTETANALAACAITETASALAVSVIAGARSGFVCVCVVVSLVFLSGSEGLNYKNYSVAYGWGYKKITLLRPLET